MEAERPYILTIAGFDPSGGAGILADIKTFEMNKVYGQAVCTAITFQNEKEFDSVKWVSVEEIISQIEILSRIHSFELVKIGLIEDFHTLDQIVTFLKKKNDDIRIVWDPILKASAGFDFHSNIDFKQVEEVCSKIFLITPNKDEIKRIYPDVSPYVGAEKLSKHCHVLLKGGHDESEKAKDILFENNNRYSFEAHWGEYGKHGTGCVLSSAILTNLAKGYDLSDACREAKEYVTEFINSHDSLLGFHYV